MTTMQKRAHGPILIILAAALAGATGCASTPAPRDKYVRAHDTVALAEATPAAKSDPRAALHLELAKIQLRHARQLMNDGDNHGAAWVLLRAEADAQTALSLAQARAAEVDAQTTIQRIRNEMQAMKQEGRGS